MPGLLRGGAAIVGAAESDLGAVAAAMSPIDLMAQATHRALADCGFSLSEVDGLFCATAQARTSGLSFAEYLGSRPPLSTRRSSAALPSSFMSRMRRRLLRPASARSPSSLMAARREPSAAATPRRASGTLTKARSGRFCRRPRMRSRLPATCTRSGRRASNWPPLPSRRAHGRGRTRWPGRKSRSRSKACSLRP